MNDKKFNDDSFEFADFQDFVGSSINSASGKVFDDLGIKNSTEGDIEMVIDSRILNINSDKYDLACKMCRANYDEFYDLVWSETSDWDKYIQILSRDSMEAWGNTRDGDFYIILNYGK